MDMHTHLYVAATQGALLSVLHREVYLIKR